MSARSNLGDAPWTPASTFAVDLRCANYNCLCLLGAESPFRESAYVELAASTRPGCSDRT